MGKRRVVATVDCETDPFKAGRTDIRPFKWGVYCKPDYWEFANTVIDGHEIHDCTDKFVEFISDKYWRVYAHNGGKFDWHFILHHLTPFQKVKIISGRLSKFTIGECEFRDSYNLINEPLSKYKKDDIDYAIMEADVRWLPENAEIIARYLKSDCVYLYEMVTAFIDKWGLHLTFATAAMKTWEKRTGKKAPNSDKAYYDEFSKFYFGGRVECFQMGVAERAFKAVDINSAYPYAMLSPHPLGLAHDYYDGAECTQKTLQAFTVRSYQGNLFYSVRAKSRGAFPCRGADKSLYFPADNEERTYHVTGWEMQAALETGTVDIVSILGIYEFSELTDFGDFILPIYEERKEAKAAGDVLLALLNKIIMCSLYGKFAANPDEYNEYCLFPEELRDFILLQDGPCNAYEINACAHHDADSYRFSGEFGPFILGARDLDEDQQTFYNIATAASITGFVRAFLWRHLCKCEGRIYCDTDSIATEHFSGFDLGTELGQWEHEGDFKSFAIAGKKLYAFEYEKPVIKKDGTTITHKTASKGVKLTAEQIISVASGNPARFEPMAPTFSVHHAPRIVARNVKLSNKRFIPIDD